MRPHSSFLMRRNNPASGIPSTGLVGWWKMLEGSGTTAADSINGNNLTIRLGTAYTWGVYSGKPVIEYTDYTTVMKQSSNTNQPTGNVAVSVAANILFESVSGSRTFAGITYCGGQAGDNMEGDGMSLSVRYGVLYFSRPNANNVEVAILNPISVNVLYNIILCYDPNGGYPGGNKNAFFVNGVSAGYANLSINFISATGGRRVGIEAGSNQLCKIGAIALYSRAIVQDDATKINAFL